MELWVRSQDRKMLSKTTYIKYSVWNEEHRIYINGRVYGKYKTKERALEVLDEIQQIINGEITMSKSVESQIVGYEKIIELNVYEMPKE